VGQAVELLAEHPHVLAVVVLAGEARLEGVERGADAEQRVAHLVGDARHQRAERGHRVAAPQLALRLDALRDVARERRQELDLAERRAVREHHLQHGELEPVRAPQPALPAPGPSRSAVGIASSSTRAAAEPGWNCAMWRLAERLVVADAEDARPARFR
jgi:hypothetical protein